MFQLSSSEFKLYWPLAVPSNSSHCHLQIFSINDVLNRQPKKCVYHFIRNGQSPPTAIVHCQIEFGPFIRSILRSFRAFILFCLYRFRPGRNQLLFINWKWLWTSFCSCSLTQMKPASFIYMRAFRIDSTQIRFFSRKGETITSEQQQNPVKMKRKSSFISIWQFIFAKTINFAWEIALVICLNACIWGTDIK